MIDFEATCWEWESDRGFYVIDRFGLGYDVRYKPARNHDSYWAIEPSTDHTAGQLEWETVGDAMRACRLHYELLATMSVPNACAEVAKRSGQVRSRRTLTGLAPVVLMLPPRAAKGAFQ